MREADPWKVVADAMQPIVEGSVPEAFRASFERQSQTLLHLASTLLQNGIDERQVRFILDQACASYRDELIAAILALRERDET